ncbi:MAG TPA: S-methyl-5-thioribose-1-phosphate isomerase [Polyangiaceae bacterium]|nr:S-methyl-5-thioribose-1-phosphate isomerase [Polyangiaceae bacterium]
MEGSLEACGVGSPLSGGAYSAVELSDDGRAVVLLDQLRLPHEERYVRLEGVAEVAEAIRAMVVRGAPAIGISAAYGMTLAGRGEGGAGAFLGRMREAGRLLSAARPTAVNLPWAVGQMLREAELVAERAPDERHTRLVARARAMHAEDVAACRAMGRKGASLLPEGVTCLTHCNAGALATGGYGTALGVLRAAWAGGKLRRVLADETRPYLQGARLTAWELARDGIEVELITEGMAGHLMARGEVGAVVVGADRVARNGDVANKVGTYGLAVLARAHGLPFFVAAPWSTVDMDCPDGGAIPIEERSSEEVTAFAGRPVAPAGVRARHPAFDVTPAHLITALITERGVAQPVGPDALRRLAEQSDESWGGGAPARLDWDRWRTTGESATSFGSGASRSTVKFWASCASARGCRGRWRRRRPSPSSRPCPRASATRSRRWRARGATSCRRRQSWGCSGRFTRSADRSRRRCAPRTWAPKGAAPTSSPSSASGRWPR